jgi:predicted AAA+ superfamily ATPase
MDFNRKIISYLKDWSEKRERKPLILRGARQVGKTFAVLFFGKKYFNEVIHINLEKIEHSRLFSNRISLVEFEKIINVSFGKSLIPEKTLIFIDEIQESPYLVNLLRFFYEERPELHVLAAGSLFEVKLKEQGFSLPVGRVEFAYLYPLDFFEYLEAINEKTTLNYLKNYDFKEKIPVGLHQKFLSLFYDYVLVGGMPEAVKVYAQNKNIQEVNNVYSSLLTSFKDDVYKYSSLAKSKYVSFVLEQAPLFAGLTVTYEKFAGSVYKSREMTEAFDLLSKTMLLHQIRATKSFQLPLIRQQKKPAKLIFLDVGLINFQMGIQSEYINIKDLNSFYQGRIAEQIVAQNLISSFATKPLPIYYWYKKTGSQAEVDFCLNYNSTILGIEVKSGSLGRLRSVYEFLKTAKGSRALRIYSGEYYRQNNIISLPLYLLPRWQEICAFF